MTTGQRLKAWRDKMGISQVKMGELIGCTQPFVSNLEEAKWRPGLEVALAIERVTEGEIPAAAWVHAEQQPKDAATAVPPTSAEVA